MPAGCKDCYQLVIEIPTELFGQVKSVVFKVNKVEQVGVGRLRLYVDVSYFVELYLKELFKDKNVKFTER